MYTNEQQGGSTNVMDVVVEFPLLGEIRASPRVPCFCWARIISSVVLARIMWLMGVGPVAMLPLMLNTSEEVVHLEKETAPSYSM